MTMLDTALLARSGIDYAEAMERFGGNEILFERLAVKYLNDPHYGGLHDALAAADMEGAHKHAHALKGVAGNLSFTALYQVASAMTDALRAGDEAEARALLPQLEQAQAAVCAVLESVKR